MNAAQFGAIQRALRKNLSKVRLGEAWNSVLRQISVGIVSGGMLHLSPGDRALLRSYTKERTGFDPLLEDLPKGRIEAAAHSPNEKLATDGPFEGLITVTSSSGEISTSRGVVSIPPCYQLTLPAEELVVDERQPAIVVENGEVIRHWTLFAKLLPSSIGHLPVAVYRGHDHTARSVKKLVDKHRKGGHLIGFFDYDLAGMRIAIEMGFDTILLPSNPQWYIENKRDKKDAFFNQQDNIAVIKKHGIEGEWLKAVKWLIDKQTGIMQEHMIYGGWELVDVSMI